MLRDRQARAPWGVNPLRKRPVAKGAGQREIGDALSRCFRARRLIARGGIRISLPDRAS
jgi:hypothetical protein